MTINGEKLRVGDCAHVFSTPSNAPYVCRILNLFVDAGNDNTAEVQWYHTLDELTGESAIVPKRRSLRKIVATYLKRIDARENEVFAGYTEKVLLASICGRCRIMLYGVKEKLPKPDEADVYSCRLAYDNTRTRFDALDDIATRVRELTPAAKNELFVEPITEKLIRRVSEKEKAEKSNSRSWYRRKRALRRIFDDDDDDDDDDDEEVAESEDEDEETKSLVDSSEEEEKDSETKREVKREASSAPESNDSETEAVGQELNVQVIDDEEEEEEEEGKAVTGCITSSDSNLDSSNSSDRVVPKRKRVTSMSSSSSSSSGGEDMKAMNGKPKQNMAKKLNDSEDSEPPLDDSSDDNRENGDEEASDTSASEEYPPHSLKQRRRRGFRPEKIGVEMMEISGSHGRSGRKRESLAVVRALEDRLSKMEKDFNVCKKYVKKLKKHLE